jgi:hypothetical protein
MDEQPREAGMVRTTGPAQPGAAPGAQAGYVAVDEPARRAPAGAAYGAPDPAYAAADQAHGAAGSAYGPAGTGAAGSAYGPAGTGAAGSAYGPGGQAGGGAAYPPGGYGSGSGEGPPRPKRRMSKAMVAAVAAAAVVVAGGVGFAATRNGNAATSQQAGPGGGFGGAGGLGGAAGGGPGGAGLGTIAHGEVVVADSSGTCTTRLVQTGTVSAVSAASITVHSADGYSATYTLGSDTSVDNGSDAVTDIATGHTVTILASTGKAAVTVTDQDLFTANGGQGGPPAPNGQNAQPGTGATN